MTDEKPEAWMTGTLHAECKGENGWQSPAALYKSADMDPLALHNFRVIAGSHPSYNNWTDVDRILQTATHLAAAFDLNFTGNHPPIAVGVKHGNACGAGVGSNAGRVFSDMVRGDPRAIFGGLVMTNVAVGETLANILVNSGMKGGKKRLLDGVIAPRFHEEAVEILARKAGKCRLMENPALEHLTSSSLNQEALIRPVRGGFLKQRNYTFVLDLKDPQLERHNVSLLSPKKEFDILMAWAIGSTSNSNTVTIVKDGQLLGNGVGQQDRVGCCELAIKRAHDNGHDTRDAVAYSDSFFPFTDGPELLAKVGIRTILASSGSVQDDAVKAVCEKYGIALIMIPDAIGRGFYRH